MSIDRKTTFKRSLVKKTNDADTSFDNVGINGNMRVMEKSGKRDKFDAFETDGFGQDEADDVEKELAVEMEKNKRKRLAAEQYLLSLQKNISNNTITLSSSQPSQFDSLGKVKAASNTHIAFSDSLSQPSSVRDAVEAALRRDVQKSRGRVFRAVASTLYSGIEGPLNATLLKGEKHHTPTTVVISTLEDGKYHVFAGFKSGIIVQWDLETRAVIRRYGLESEKGKNGKDGKKGHVLSLALSPDRTLIVSGGRDGIIRVWRTGDGSLLSKFTQHRGPVTGLAFQQYAQVRIGMASTLFSVSSDRTVKIWTLSSAATAMEKTLDSFGGKELSGEKDDEQDGSDTESLSEGNNSKSTGTNGIFLVAQSGYVDTLFGHQDEIPAVAGLLVERCVTVGGRDRTVRVWKVAEETQLLFRPPENSGSSLTAVAAIDNEHFVTGSDSGAISLWSIAKKKPLFTLQNAHELEGASDSKASMTTLLNDDLEISCMAVLPQTDLVVSASVGSVCVWGIDSVGWRSLKLLRRIPIVGCVNGVTLSADGRYLAVAVGRDQRLGRWCVVKESKNCIQIFDLLCERPFLLDDFAEF